MSVSRAVIGLSVCLVFTYLLASVQESDAATIATNTNVAKVTEADPKQEVADAENTQNRHLDGVPTRWPGPNGNRPNRPNRPGYGPSPWYGGGGGNYWSGGRPQWWQDKFGGRREDCPPWFRIYGSTYCYKYWRYFENMDPWTARDIVHNTEPWS